MAAGPRHLSRTWILKQNLQQSKKKKKKKSDKKVLVTNTWKANIEEMREIGLSFKASLDKQEDLDSILRPTLTHQHKSVTPVVGRQRLEISGPTG